MSEPQSIPNASKAPEPQEGRDNRRALLVVYMLITAVLVVLMALDWKEVVRWVGDTAEVSPEHLRKLDKEIREIEYADQYVLRAQVDGWYECLTCASKKIFLHAGEVWKYGVTRMGMSGRYGSEYLAQKNVAFFVQFSGDYAQCLIEEKKKLYFYPVLPENLARADSLRLTYPPGNSRSNQSL